MNNELLKKNKKLHYFLKCLRRSSDNDFVTKVLNFEYDATAFHLRQLGGKNQDKLFYYIGTVAKRCGFFDQHLQLLELLIVSERLHAIPIVYYGEDYLYYDHGNDKKSKNAFEYYFKPISEIPYEEVKESYNVIIAESMHRMYAWGEDEYTEAMSKGNGEIRYDINMHPGFEKPDFMKKLAEMQKKYIVLNNDVKMKISKEICTLFEGQRVLGVHVRGTDYKKGYSNCEKYANPDMHLEKVKKYMDGFDKIFLATDNEETIQLFKKEIGSKLCYYTDVYRSQDNNEGIHYSVDTRKMHKYNLGYEVLRDMITLASCNALVAGKSSVSIVAQIYKSSMEQLYDFIDIIDMGRYK